MKVDFLHNHQMERKTSKSQKTEAEHHLQTLFLCTVPLNHTRIYKRLKSCFFFVEQKHESTYSEKGARFLLGFMFFLFQVDLLFTVV